MMERCGKQEDGSWVPMNSGPDWSDVWEVQRQWSDHTFGTPDERGPYGPLDHLRKEVEEAITSPDDVEEFADLHLLVWDAARRAGHTYWQLKQAVINKLAKNQRRKWPDASGVVGVVEHVRTEER